MANAASAPQQPWLPAAHRFKDVYDAGVIGNRGLQFQRVIAWNQGTTDHTKRGWIVTGQDENGVRLSMDYGATWGFPRLAGMFSSKMAGLYLNTDDDVFVAIGAAFSDGGETEGCAGLYVGDGSLLWAKRVEITRPDGPGPDAPGGGKRAFTTPSYAGNSFDRNGNFLARRPQTGGLTDAQRPIWALEQVLSGGNVSFIALFKSSDGGATFDYVSTLANSVYASGDDGLYHVLVAPNGDLVILGRKGLWLSPADEGANQGKSNTFTQKLSHEISSGFFYGGGASSASGMRIGVYSPNANGGVWEVSNIRTGTFARKANTNVPANHGVWHVGGSPMNPNRLAICTLKWNDDPDPKIVSGPPYYSTDGGATFSTVGEVAGTGDTQGRYNVRGKVSGGHAGFHFCPTDEQICLTPTSQTMARSIDGAETSDGDLTAFFDGMHAKGIGYHRSDYKKMGRVTQDSGLNISLDGMHWVRDTGTANGNPFSAVVNGVMVNTFGKGVEAAGGGNNDFMSGSGMAFGTVNDRVVGFFNKNTAGQTNIPVIMENPDANGDYQDILILSGMQNLRSRCVNGAPSPKSSTVAFVGRWAISDLGAASMSNVLFTDHNEHEFIDCFLDGTTLISYWGNFKSGSAANEKTGNEIYRSTADLGDNNQSAAWYTLPSGRYPCRAICVDPHANERVLYVRTDDLHVIREVKRVGGSLTDTALVNLRTMDDGLLDILESEVGSGVSVPEMPIQQLLSDPNKVGVFYAIMGRHGVPNFWMTTDNGVTWSNISDNAPRTLWTAMVHPLTGELLAFGSMGEHVRKSPDITGYPSLTNRDAFSNQLSAYFAPVNTLPSVSTSSLPDAMVGESYNQTLSGSSGNGPRVWSLASGALPTGLSLSPSGVISGTATSAGTSNFTVRLADSDLFATNTDTDTQALSIAVTADSAPTIVTSSLPNGSVGVAYSQSLSATGGNGALVWSVDSGSLPAGLSLSSGGTISGTPTTAATSNFTVRVADSDGHTGGTDEDTQALSITVGSSGPVGVFAANEDIGGPGLAGSASHNSGTGVYTVTGGGNDIYGTSDKFRFVHEPWTGDGRIIARVTAVENTHAWAKAGVMFRESTAADSKNVDLVLSATSGTQFLYRATTGGTTQYNVVVPDKSAPYWLKLERHGNTFTGWQSPDGVAWFLTDATTFTMNSGARVGLAVTAHNNADLNTSTFDNVSLSAVPSWTATDIGTPGAAGNSSVNYSTDLYTIEGAGNNIYGTSDSFQFYYQSWANGDATFIAEVISVENTHNGAKAALIIRQSLSADSPHATIAVMPVNGVEMLTRTTSGGTTTQQLTSGIGAPRFIKLVRSGDSFTAYQSPDAGTWTQVGSAVTVSMSGTVYIGLASCSRVSGTLCTSTFSSVFLK